MLYRDEKLAMGENDSIVFDYFFNSSAFTFTLN
jgi:hypothetical protein